MGAIVHHNSGKQLHFKVISPRQYLAEFLPGYQIANTLKASDLTHFINSINIDQYENYILRYVVTVPGSGFFVAHLFKVGEPFEV